MGKEIDFKRTLFDDLVDPSSYKFFGKYPRYVLPEHALYIIATDVACDLFSSDCCLVHFQKLSACRIRFI